MKQLRKQHRPEKRRRYRAADPRRRPRRVRPPRHRRHPDAGDRRRGRRQPGAAALLLPQQGAAGPGRLRARRERVHAGGGPGDRVRRRARGQGAADHRPRARSPVARAVSARLHHRRGHAPSRARRAADRRRHRADAAGARPPRARHAAPPDQGAGQGRRDAADRARVVRRQPDGALHLSVRGPADDPGDARPGRPRASDSSSRAGARSCRPSSWERCGHDASLHRVSGGCR